MVSEAGKVLLRQLKDPFDPSLVKWRSGGGGKQLAYIDARDVMKRLDTVLGADRYQTNYTPVDGGFICLLSIKIDDEWITRSDGANNTKVEPLKGGISSALKRAANAWGIGRYLYYLDPAKFNRNNVTNWPKWALPGNNMENWEDVAELEAGANTGMDEEEVVSNALTVAESIHNAETAGALADIIEKMSSDEQRIFGDMIANKTQELVGGNTDSES